MCFYACNDTGYEIEEQDQTDAPKTETKPEIKEDVEQPKTDIKQEVDKEKKVSAKMYTIQLGAFTVESNAKDFIKKAEKSLNFEITYKISSGLYKVTTGAFSNKSDAISNLVLIVNAGFKDPFITELNK